MSHEACATTGPRIYTIGHSTLSLEAFARRLRTHAVVTVVDVRRFAGSRRFPHFDAPHLANELPKMHLRYLPCPLLGGRRRSGSLSANTAWRNASFRAYADYMQSEQFMEGLTLLLGEARERPTAMMCAEAVPWRCHRSLIADACTVRGWTVVDIMSEAKANVHRLTSFASVRGTCITYPGE